MGKYIVKRLLWMIPVVLGVAVLIFTIMYFTPGDPAKFVLGTEATAEQSQAVSQVTQGMDQISSVVQTNSATAEESAAASEELSGQAVILKELVGQFKTR